MEVRNDVQGPHLRLRRLKPYKARDPSVTIEHARGVLRACDLFVVETHRTHGVSGVHFCRLMLGDEDVRALNIGVNGKGLTARWALASAYGELMERLQNGVLLPQRQSWFATGRYLQGSADGGSGLHVRLRERGLLLEHLYAPDEVYQDAERVVAECGDVLVRMLRAPGGAPMVEYLRGLSSLGEPIPCLPFYSVTAGEVRLLPAEMLRLTCASNGMCAGNTPSEALVQGLSEVVERYAMRVLHLDGVVPPTVPLEWFAGTIVHDRLQRIRESQGMTVVVKDCSLGLGLPVLGLLLVDAGRRRWAFHIGADPSPITALERCLTELYQGDRHALAGRFHEMPRRGEGCGADGAARPSQDERSVRRAAYREAVVTGSGRYPPAVLGSGASYGFTGFEHPVSVSDEDDLRYLVDKVTGLGFDLFVRDVSALGFPAYQVYVPGMSENDHWMDPAERASLMGVLGHVRTILDLRRAGRTARERLWAALGAAVAIEAPAAPRPSRWFLSHDDEGLRGLTAEELLNGLRTSLAEPWPATSGGRPTGDARDLAAARPEGTVVVPDRAWAGLDLPSCFDCDVCPVAASCRYVAVIERVKRVQERQSGRFPDQAAVAGLL